MKTERVTLLTSPNFKAFLSAEALREGVSVAELVRTRCERRPSEEETVLAALTGELNKAVGEAKRALKGGLDEAQAVLTELRAKRAGADLGKSDTAKTKAGRSGKLARLRA
jgi:predicted phage gp36 major capsid-like protein